MRAVDLLRDLLDCGTVAVNELVKALQARIADLERENARYENARIICGIELGYWRSRALGLDPLDPQSHHPDTELAKLLASSAVSSYACGTFPAQDDRSGERQVTNPAAAESLSI